MNAGKTAIFLVIFCAAAFGIPGYGSEMSIPRAALPAAVQKTANEQSTGAVIKRYVKDNENGQLEYEVEMMINGHSKDVSIARDGRLLEIEEQVAMSDLPLAVQEGLKNKAGKGSISKIESITKKERVVAYEAQVRTNGRHSEIQVGPDGKALDHEE
jgi:hypothetical protein